MDGHIVNKAILGSRQKIITEGIIERENQVWMHPIRCNQYLFSETAPFPEVFLPLKVGKKWGGRLHISTGWGIWENTVWRDRYRVKGNESRNLGVGNLENCWRIEARSRNFRFGTSRLTFWYHDELGFVEIKYLNYEKQMLHLTLENVE